VGLGGGVEASPGPVGQLGDPFGPEHRWELAKHAWQAPGGHDRHPSTTTLPQGTPGRRGRPRTASPLWGSARTRAARSASKDTALRVGASGQRPCLSRPQALSRSRPRYCLDSITNTPRGQSPGGQGWPGCHGRPGRAGPPIPAAPAGRAGGRCAAPRPPPAAQATASGLGLNRSPQPAAMAASAPTTRPSRSTSRRPRTPHRRRQWWRSAKRGSGSMQPIRPPATAATSPLGGGARAADAGSYPHRHHRASAGVKRRPRAARSSRVASGRRSGRRRTVPRSRPSRRSCARGARGAVDTTSRGGCGTPRRTPGPGSA
jgi:hypothetical protein